MEGHERPDEDVGGFDRRALLKRGAVVGGAAVWATPVVQSLARPAFAAGSPVCTDFYSFKYEMNERGGGRFDSGLPTEGSPAADCLPPGYAEGTPINDADGSVPGTPGSITITLLDKTKAQVVLPAGAVLLAGNGKAGGNSTAECRETYPVGTQPDGRNVYEVDLVKGISFIAGVICVS